MRMNILANYNYYLLAKSQERAELVRKEDPAELCFSYCGLKDYFYSILHHPERILSLKFDNSQCIYIE